MARRLETLLVEEGVGKAERRGLLRREVDKTPVSPGDGTRARALHAEPLSREAELGAVNRAFGLPANYERDDHPVATVRDIAAFFDNRIGRKDRKLGLGRLEDFRREARYFCKVDVWCLCNRHVGRCRLEEHQRDDKHKDDNGDKRRRP